MKTGLSPNGLHRDDMTMIGEIQAGQHRISIAGSGTCRDVQVCADGVYSSGSCDDAAVVLDAWLDSVPAPQPSADWAVLRAALRKWGSR